MRTLIVVIQAAGVIACAPLVSGIIRKIKNTVRMRSGARIVQPYFDLWKLWGKGEVVSANASWIFTAAPYVVFASTAVALMLVPMALPGVALGGTGDLFAVVFILALGRFFLALAGLDTGSAFGGMGSSREMFISSFAEPVAVLAFFAVGLSAGTTSLVEAGQGQVHPISPLIAAGALFCVMLAETSRIPVDNQETHLELTMVHEAMVLEYSGRSLALIELASHARQMLWYSLIALAVFPHGFAGAGAIGIAAGACLYLLKVGAIALSVALLEVSVAKMRLFRVVDFLMFAYVLSGMAVVTAVMGL